MRGAERGEVYCLLRGQTVLRLQLSRAEQGERGDVVVIAAVGDKGEEGGMGCGNLEENALELGGKLGALIHRKEVYLTTGKRMGNSRWFRGEGTIVVPCLRGAQIRCSVTSPWICDCSAPETCFQKLEGFAAVSSGGRRFNFRTEPSFELKTEQGVLFMSMPSLIHRGPAAAAADLSS